MRKIRRETADWRGILARWASLPDQTHRERAFQNWLHGELSAYFHIGREIEGRTHRSGKSQRIDFLAKPRPRVKTNGFPDVIFGIEVKFSYGWEFDERRDWAAQMLNYRATSFWNRQTNQFDIIPAFILSAPGLSTAMLDGGVFVDGGILSRVGIWELDFRTRMPHDPQGDCWGDSYETVFEIVLKEGRVFWGNIRGRPGGGIGGAKEYIDHPDFEQDERDFHRNRKQGNRRDI